MGTGELALFSLGRGRELAARVGAQLGVEPGAIEERDFEDGEHKSRPLESVRGRDLYVVQSIHTCPDASVNDVLVRLLFFLGALRDASASRLTAVVPYLAYARKDRKTKARDPVTTRYVAAMFEAVGVDRVVTVDVHNLAAFQNAFRIHTDHLEARSMLVRHALPLIGDQPAAVVSPDAGGVKRADALRRTLEARLRRAVGSAFMDKQRSEGVVSGSAFVGDVNGRVALIVDDLVASGTTLARAAVACRERGATAVHALATHGAFTGGAGEILARAPLDSLAVLDTMPPFRLDGTPARDKLVLLDAAPLLAGAIRRLHGGGSIVSLLDS